MHSEQTPTRSYFGRRHFHALFVAHSLVFPSLYPLASEMKGWYSTKCGLYPLASEMKKIVLELWSLDGTYMTVAYLSITKAGDKKNTKCRAVLRVVGEKGRKYGTKYEDPSLTAKNLLETMGPRIHSAERDRVVEIVKNLVWIELTESCLTYRDLR